MGRHSAPDDADEDDGVAASSTLALAPDAGLAAVIESRGRHARGDAAPDMGETQRISVVPDEPDPPDPPEPLFALDLHTITEPRPVEPDVPDGPTVDERAAKAERRAAEKAAKKAAKDARESDTRADLRLLRHNAAVRAQAIGAVIAAFLLYTVVMIVLGRTTDYLQWLWVPIVVAGVLVGLVLDLAHRRHTKQGEQAAAGAAPGDAADQAPR